MKAWSSICSKGVAEQILAEQKKGPYNTIVVGGTKMTKAQEFIFGNIAIKLLRKSDCSVITVF